MTELVKALLSGLGGTIGWGSADFLSASAMKKQKLDVVAACFWLHAFGAVFLLLFLPTLKFGLKTKVDYPFIDELVILQLLLFALMNVITYLCFFKALSIGYLSVISSVFSTYAAGAVIVSVVFFGETIPFMRLIALFVIIFGIILISVENPAKFKNAKGVAWVIPAVILFSIFFPYWDSLASKGGAAILVLIIDILIALIFFIYAKLKKIRLVFPSKVLGIMFLASIFNSIAGLSVAWGYQSTTLTSIVSVISSAVPLTSVTLGYLFLKERLRPTQYLGLFGLIIGGVLLFM